MAYGNGMRGGRNEMDLERERGMYGRSSWRGGRAAREGDWSDERESWRGEPRSEATWRGEPRADYEDRWSARPAGDYPSEPSWGGRSPYNTDDRGRDSRWRGENQRRDDARDYDRGFGGGSVGGGYGAQGYGSSQQQQRWRGGEGSAYDTGARGHGVGAFGGGHEGQRGFGGADSMRGPSMSDPRSAWTPQSPWEGSGSNPSADTRSYGSSAHGTPGYGRGNTQQLERGAHIGRGPKGYRRNDERIREDVCERLKLAHDVDASEIEVTVSNGEVTLNGTVESRQEKRMAEECVEGVSGVDDVDNRLKVKSRSESSTDSSRGASSAGVGSLSSSTQSKSTTDTKGATGSGSQSKSNTGRSTYES